MGSKVKKYGVLFCAGIIVAFFASFVSRIVVQKVFGEKYHMNLSCKWLFLDKDDNFVESKKNKDKRTDNVLDAGYWERRYPFKNVETCNEAEKKSRLRKWQDATNERMEGLRNKLNLHMENYLFGYNQMVSWSRKYEELLGKNLELVPINSVYKLPDDYLTFFHERKSTHEMVKNVKQFFDYGKTLGAECVYICAPFKVWERDTGCYGIKDFSNQNADEFLHGLEKNGIRYIDLREQIRRQKWDNHTLFFRTDHHWLPATALWATNEVGTFLNRELGKKIAVENFDPERFRRVTYEKWFLGVQGKKVTLQNAIPDDIDLFYTKDKADLHLCVPSRGVDIKGAFDVWYDMKEIEPRNYYESKPYSAYGYGENPFVRVHNNGVVPDVKVLLVRDSFGDAFYPFFSLGVRDMTIVDLRYFTGSLVTLAEEEKPDIILVLYNPDMFDWEMDYRNHKDIWDFR